MASLPLRITGRREGKNMRSQTDFAAAITIAATIIVLLLTW
jgi:hypothetical protein